LAACGGGEHEDLKQWMNESTKDLVGKVPPLPEIKPFPVVAYDAINLVSPFAPSRIEPDKRPVSTGIGPRPDLNRRKEPLEAFPLESLKMVGSMIQGNIKQAIVQADKSTYQVKVGNYMGQNFGVITSVTETEVTLKELVEDSNGDWSERTSKMLLQERPQETKR
jgi:type IV pilus assembly protein PilP